MGRLYVAAVACRIIIVISANCYRYIAISRRLESVHVYELQRCFNGVLNLSDGNHRFKKHTQDYILGAFAHYTMGQAEVVFKAQY